MKKLNKALITLAMLSSITLSGCGAISAQNPGEGFSPVNAVAMGESKRVMLAGADVVAYFTEGKYVQGTEAERVRLGGIDFYFASSINKALFQENPQRYLPQYGGYCANGIMFGIPWGGNAQDWLVHKDRLYIFGGADSKAVFQLQLEQNIALSDKYWKEEIDGNNSFLQRFRRLVLRVPHYQTGEEQARLLKAARGG